MHSTHVRLVTLLSGAVMLAFVGCRLQHADEEPVKPAGLTPTGARLSSPSPASWNADALLFPSPSDDGFCRVHIQSPGATGLLGGVKLPMNGDVAAWGEVVIEYFRAGPMSMTAEDPVGGRCWMVTITVPLVQRHGHETMQADLATLLLGLGLGFVGDEGGCSAERLAELRRWEAFARSLQWGTWRGPDTLSVVALAPPSRGGIPALTPMWFSCVTNPNSEPKCAQLEQLVASHIANFPEP